MHKYLIINTDYAELIQAVEMSEHQADAMMWLIEKLNLENTVLFIRVDDSPLHFEEVI